jgi:hypothetical protein
MFRLDLNFARVLAWLAVALIMLNTLCFVLRVASPVVRDDDWYFLDVFLRKAIDGGLSVGDFFIKRYGSDHAQPLFKLEMLLEWRYFDLDFAVGSILGVIAAAVCAVIYYRIIVAERHGDRSDVTRYLAWASICAVLISLNGGGGSWTWPLVALENVTSMIILLFMLVVWHSHRSQRYIGLAIATLFLCISSDDSALIAVIATVLALLLAQLCDRTQRRRSTWKILAVIGVCTVVVRIGYAYAPVVGGTPSMSILSNMGLLHDRFVQKGWWMWAALPLTLPVYTQSPFGFIGADGWVVVQVVMAVILLTAHLWFWGAAFRTEYSRLVFVAVCLMILSYGWVAGIILGRVTIYGNNYLNEPRYLLLYGGHLIALLLLWASSSRLMPRLSGWRRALGSSAPAAGCVILLLGQIPLSIHAWGLRPYEWIYYVQMAHQINDLAKDPVHPANCVPELPICGWPLEKRRELTRLLSENRLNVFSPKVQRWHSYLPPLSPDSP